MRRSTLLGAALGIACLVASSLPHALAAPAPSGGASEQGSERDEARKLAYAGITALQEGRAEEALEQLLRAEQTFHAPTNVLYIARARTALGRLVEAHHTYVAVLAEPIPNYAPEAFHEARKQAEEEANALLPRIAAVRVRIDGADPTQTEVRIDGSRIEPARLSYPIALEPGAHELEASGPDGVQATARVSAVVGESPEVRLVLKATASDRPAGAIREPVDEDQGDGMVAGGAVLLVVGALSLGAGAVMGGMTLSEASDIEETCGGTVCPAAEQSRVDDATVVGDVATALLAVGGAAALTGIVLLAVGLDGSAPDAPMGSSEGASVRRGEHRGPAAALRFRLGIGSATLSGRF